MSQLTDLIRSKYPQYTSVPDADLERRVLAKYPQYKPYATKSIGDFAGNVVNSGGRLIGDTVKAVANVGNVWDIPSGDFLKNNTVANLARLGGDTVGAIGDVASGNQVPQDNRARQLVEFYKQRYGKDLGKTLYEDPVGALADVATLLTGAGAVVGGVGKLGKVSTLARAGELLGEAGAIADPISLSGKLGSRGLNTVLGRSGKALEGAGTRLTTSGLGNPAKQAEIAAKGGRPVADFMEQYNLYSRSPGDANAVVRQIMDKYDSLATNSGKTVEINKIAQLIDDKIAELGSGAGKFSDNNLSAIDELTRRKAQLLSLAESPNVGLDQIVEYRRALDKDIPRSAFNLDARQSGTVGGAKATRDILKDTINSTDLALEQLGKDYGMAKGVGEIFKRSEARRVNRSPLSLGKVATAGVGSVVAGLPGMVGGMVVDQLTQSPQFLQASSKGLKNVGKAMQGVDLSGIAKPVRTAYEAGRTLRTLSPTDTSKTMQGSIPATGVSPQVPGKQSPATQSLSSPSVTPGQMKAIIALPKTPKSIFARTPKVTKGKFY